MEISVGELLSLDRVVNEVSNQKIDTLLGYKIARILRKIANEVVVAEETRTKTIMPYVKKDEKGEPIVNDNNTYDVIDGKQAEVAKALNNFFDTKITIDVPLLTLKDLEQMELTPKQIETLIPIIDDKD